MNNSACAQFPPAVRVNLTVASSAVPQILITTLSNFNYSTTSMIDVRIPQLDLQGNPIDLSSYQQETFAVLQIYSYSLLTQIEIFTFDELRSDLDNCFSEIR